ncbi:MAG: peptide-methionine (S)-S-oxide reductase [Tenericutes bacterium HGW-Tenericutes-1]|jgi:methionine-S-sulfoxide reductase|nr:MAG: peptide-methionine (S)-S-oxide reductase [Tenericutes bacterium HGW-Tenericutes-1]
MKKIILAGGCFWGVEAYFSRVKGVETTQVGYTDAEGKNPTYKDVCNSSGHVEAVYITYNELVTPLTKILEHFFRIIDPTENNRQGHDIGVQYRTAIFYYDESDVPVIQDYLTQLQKKYTKKIYTYLKPAGIFYDAEDYHQDYLLKNPTGYCHINLHLLKKEEAKE